MSATADLPVLLTGASSGIGAATATVLDRSGLPLVLIGRNEARLKKVATQLKNKSQIIVADLNSAHAAEKILEQYKAGPFKGKKIASLINNAAIFHRKSFLTTTDEEWLTEINVNLLSPVRLIRTFLPQIVDAGAIVNISSTLGIRPVINTVAYSAVKAALNNLTQGLALELAPRIRVCAVCPGLTDTEIHPFHGQPDSSPDRVSAHKAQPMGRMGRPEEIAEMINFLIGPNAKWITGSLHVIDGGISLL